MVKIEIRCPICDTIGYISVPQEIVDKSARGLVTINIGKKLCEHSFIAYLDKNYNVRDCFITDFQIEIPEMDLKHKVEEHEIPTIDKVDLDLIKFNLSPNSLIYLIRSVILGEKVLISTNDDFMYSHLTNFFNFIFRNSFEYDILIKEKDYYSKNKKKYKNHVVFDNQEHLINDKKKLLNLKKIKIEKVMIQKFLSEDNPKFSMIILKNEIQKAFELSKALSERIIEFKNDHESNEVDIHKLLDNLIEGQKIKIELPYLKFLIEIAEHYFHIEIPMVWKFFLYRI